MSLLSYLYFASQKRAAEQEREESYQQIDFSPEEIKEDLDYFQDLMKRVHPDQMPTHPLGDITAKLQAWRKSINQSLTRLAFYREFAPIVSLLNDDHVVVHLPEPELTNRYRSGGEFFPFRVQFINNRLYVVQNLSGETATRASMEILSINGVPAEELRTILIGYFSGTSNAQKLFYLQDHFHEALFLVYGFSEHFELTLHDSATHKTSKLNVSGQALPKPTVEKFHYQVIETDTILFTYNAFADENGSFAPFLKGLFSTAQEQNIQHLILDIRRNQGGNSAYGDDIFRYLMDKPFIQADRSEFTISKERKASFIRFVPGFMRWIPLQYLHPFLRGFWFGKEGDRLIKTFEPVMPEENLLRFSGDVTLLVGPGTMSSATLFSATMKEYSIGTLIGEETGGYATQYGEIIDVYLPNTGLRLWMPTSVIHGNGTRAIVPDHSVTQTASDLVDQQDTVLAFARNLIHPEQ
ncbi:MAG: S41 family peptidase [Chloroflexota bacterium]